MVLALGRLAALATAVKDASGFSPRNVGQSASAQAFQSVAHQLCRSHGIDVVSRGPCPPPGSVLVANHVSYIDALVLPSLLPSTCIAKCEVARWPGIGAAARRLGILFVDRKSPWSGARALRAAAHALEAGVAVVVFPEGTTTPGDRVLPFKRGIFGIARRLDVPVFPVTIAYQDARIAWVGDQSFLGHYLLQIVARRTIHARLTFSDSLAPRAFDSISTFAEAARERVEAGLLATSESPCSSTTSRI